MSRVIAVRQGYPRAVVSAGLRGVRGGPGPMGPAFQVDATGVTADRTLYDGEPEGFAFLDTTTGLLYFRQGAGWSDGVQFQGPKGLDGRGITSLTINSSGHLIAIYTDAAQVDLGRVVGAAGEDGRGIASVAIDGGGHLIITYTDGTAEDAGAIPGAGGSVTWGAIGGTLADQVDLVAALAGKASAAQGALADTAVQPSVLAAGLGGKVDKVAGLGLSQESFTTAEKSKLAGLDGPLWKGTYTSLAALQSAHPTAEPGSSAHVDAGLGDPVKVYNWDASDGEWVAGGGDAAPVTAAQVKTLYESNADTNAYTDAEKSKLGGVAAGATANASTDSLPEGATNLYHSPARVRQTPLTGISLIDAAVVAATDTVLQAIGKLAGRLATAFNRDNHTGTQAISTVTGLQDALDAKQAALVSAFNIKTVGGNSLLGAGDIAIPSAPPPAALPTRTIIGTADTITPADAGRMLICTSATPVTLTIAAEATASWAQADAVPVVHVFQAGAGAVTITGAGFTVTTHAGDTNVLAGNGAAVTAMRTASNTWRLFGRLVAA